MPILTPTRLEATIRFLGINDTGEDLSTTTQQTVNVTYAGFTGDSHSGLTRPSCSRVQSQYPKGTEIRNTRQLCALSIEELTEIQATIGVDKLAPNWLGANLVVEGLPEFSKLPPASRLIAANGTSVVVDMENAPCKFPGDIIEQHRPGYGRHFPRAALGKRGITLWVEREGELAINDTLVLHVPPACSWQSHHLPQ